MLGLFLVLVECSLVMVLKIVKSIMVRRMLLDWGWVCSEVKKMELVDDCLDCIGDEEGSVGVAGCGMMCICVDVGCGEDVEQ